MPVDASRRTAAIFTVSVKHLLPVVSMQFRRCSVRSRNSTSNSQFVVNEKVRDVVEEGLGGKSRKRKVGTERLIEIEEEMLAIKRARLAIEQRRLEIEEERLKMEMAAHQSNYFVFGNVIDLLY